MRTCHGCALHTAVAVVRNRTEDFLTLCGITARSNDVHPISIVGIISKLIIACYRRYCNASFIRCRISLLQGIVSGCKDRNATLHRTVRKLVSILVAACIGIEVVDRLLDVFRRIRKIVGRQISPAVLGDHGTMVCCPHKRISLISQIVTFEYLT